MWNIRFANVGKFHFTLRPNRCEATGSNISQCALAHYFTFGWGRIFHSFLPIPPNPRTDSNRHTVGVGASTTRKTPYKRAFVGASPYRSKKYLQSHRCNGVLDRFGLTKHLKCLQNSGIMETERWWLLASHIYHWLGSFSYLVFVIVVNSFRHNLQKGWSNKFWNNTGPVFSVLSLFLFNNGTCNISKCPTCMGNSLFSHCNEHLFFGSSIYIPCRLCYIYKKQYL